MSLHTSAQLSAARHLALDKTSLILFFPSTTFFYEWQDRRPAGANEGDPWFAFDKKLKVSHFRNGASYRTLYKPFRSIRRTRTNLLDIQRRPPRASMNSLCDFTSGCYDSCVSFPSADAPTHVFLLLRRARPRVWNALRSRERRAPAVVGCILA